MRPRRHGARGGPGPYDMNDDEAHERLHDHGLRGWSHWPPSCQPSHSRAPRAPNCRACPVLHPATELTFHRGFHPRLRATATQSALRLPKVLPTTVTRPERELKHHGCAHVSKAPYSCCKGSITAARGNRESAFLSPPASP